MKARQRKHHLGIWKQEHNNAFSKLLGLFGTVDVNVRRKKRLLPLENLKKKPKNIISSTFGGALGGLWGVKMKLSGPFLAHGGLRGSIFYYVLGHFFA